MPSSKQLPLTARRGGHEHDFSQPRADWEAAVFDRAAYFAVIKIGFGMLDRGGNTSGYPERRFEFFPWAVRYARLRGGCIYAVTETGRFNLCDRDKWDEWATRWWETRDEHGQEVGAAV